MFYFSFKNTNNLFCSQIRNWAEFGHLYSTRCRLGLSNWVHSDGWHCGAGCWLVTQLELVWGFNSSSCGPPQCWLGFPISWRLGFKSKFPEKGKVCLSSWFPLFQAILLLLLSYSPNSEHTISKIISEFLVTRLLWIRSSLFWGLIWYYFVLSSLLWLAGIFPDSISLDSWCWFLTALKCQLTCVRY